MSIDLFLNSTPTPDVERGAFLLANDLYGVTSLTHRCSAASHENDEIQMCLEQAGIGVVQFYVLLSQVNVRHSCGITCVFSTKCSGKSDVFCVWCGWNTCGDL
jgi:hypothetical protein